MKEKDTRITARVTENERQRAAALAKKCGLSQTEYIRQRVLGYEPRSVPPDVLFYLCERIDTLIDKNISAEVSKAALSLLSDISRELIAPRKEVMSKWLPPASGQSKDG